jgi:glycosyltransferase involved in cell wall biosynthesis
MTVCYFGTYLRKYSRNRIIQEGLKRNNVEVKECHVDLWGNAIDRFKDIKGFIQKIKISWKIVESYFLLIKKYATIGKYDVMIVGYTGHFDMFLARLLSAIHRHPLYFDAFISLYDTYVEDRQMTSTHSPLARILRWIDRKSCSMADGVFLDTDEHIDYFRTRLELHQVKFYRIWVGAEDNLFYPGSEKESDVFKVLFYGSMIPLQGVDVILRAAKILEKHPDIHFEIIGKGQLSEKMNSLTEELHLKNVTFQKWVDYELLPKKILESDVCLGIFGNTAKAKRVIPNKVYQALAVRKPVITGNSPAAREAFTHRNHVILSVMGDPEDLAKSILMLKEDQNIRNKISENGYKLFKNRFTQKKIGHMVNEIILKQTISH